jgi:uncharacterized protein DUF1553/uncharacterized protein DUF1549/concanavalin A-like lectin/glucanase superfamily protein/cytochrome c
MRSNLVWSLLLAEAFAVGPVAMAAEPVLSGNTAPLPDKIEFNRDIRPFLSDTCFRCHGPDKNTREADLRLDLREAAIADRESIRPIVPGKPEASQAWLRVIAEGTDALMPPPKSNLKLTPRQKALFKRWIEQGAEYQPHWAFLAPQRPEVPRIADLRLPIAELNGGGGGYSDWTRSPIDGFVLTRLIDAGLAPAPEAPPETLIRRLSLDLTGLPPTPEEVDRFIQHWNADPSSEGRQLTIGNLLDGLLASPRYGERMAFPWLDAARYADTSGYQADWERFLWPWRDWVIRAFNDNMPFNQFTIEQIAGDMLPQARTAQRIATGFNRNHRINDESGIIPEEWLAEYVVDRVETTSTVWLGLTAGCARCHDHKYDPLSQKEFYQLFAYFHNVPESGKDGRKGWANPSLKLPTPQQAAQLDALGQQLRETESALQAHLAKLDTALAVWEASRQSAEAALDTSLQHGLAGRFFQNEEDGLEDLSGQNVAATLTGNAAWTPGKSSQAFRFDGKTQVSLGHKLGAFDRDEQFAFAAWINLAGREWMTVFTRRDESAADRGYSLTVDREGHVEFVLAHHGENNVIHVVSTNALATDRWHHVAVAYGGTGQATGVKLFLDGKPAAVRVVQDALTDSPLPEGDVVLEIGGRESAHPLRGAVEDFRIYERALSEAEVTALGGENPIDALLDIPVAQRTPAQREKIRAFYLVNHDPEHKRLTARVEKLRKEQGAAEAKVVTTMVMEEMPQPRDTFVLLRGEYNKRGEKVSPGLPVALPPLPPAAPNNRFGFAQWLVHPSNPLTARVTVNRFWQQYFGTGIVKTSEDFGAQGDWPSHPELLDWLATEFIRSGWDVKALQKLIVMSATYRQSSKVRPTLWERDPENRLLARGPRYRLPAPTLRDQALSASGLLVEKLGGPSVKPYQPAGLWEEISFNRKDVSTDFYVQDHGDKLWRRSLYTFWKRTVAPPGMSLFDASGREMCGVRPKVTNTPLQALALMNDVTFVEAARALAERMLIQGGSTPAERVTHGWRLVLARKPSARELEVLLKSLDRHREKFDASPDTAKKLLSVGEAPLKPDLPPSELAAYTAVANTILNLDETVTKE